MNEWQQWLGTTQTTEDVISLAPVKGMAATLDRLGPATGDALPPLWHWLYFLPTAPSRDLGHDGHATRGGFLPPVPLPRRMWAGSRLHLQRPLLIGEHARRDSRITNIVSKKGRSGQLVIVTVLHEVHADTGLVFTEEQDIVFREAPGATENPPAAPAQKSDGPDAQWSRELIADPVLLFRYSALTFNAHRIHYDHPYATREEGYPGLVVHGPLTATLLVETFLQEHPDARIATMNIRAQRPLFHGRRFLLEGRVCADGRQAQLWSLDAHGAVTMQIEATLNRQE